MKKLTWDDLPIEIQNRMLNCQEEQGNPRNSDVFKKCVEIDSKEGGFNWFRSEEGASFWADVLSYQKIEIFYERYPKKDLSMLIDDVINKFK